MPELSLAAEVVSPAAAVLPELLSLPPPQPAIATATAIAVPQRKKLLAEIFPTGPRQYRINTQAFRNRHRVRATRALGPRSLA